MTPSSLSRLGLVSLVSAALCAPALAQTAPTTTATPPAAQSQTPPAASAPSNPLALQTDVNNNQDSQRYSIRMEGDNVRFRLSVNGIPLFSKVMHKGEILLENFNEYLKVGANIIEIQLDKFSTADQSAASYEVFFQSPTQVVTGESTSLYKSPEKVTLPLRHPLGMRIKTIPSLRLWKAERMLQNEDEKAKLIEALNAQRQQLIDALSRNDNAYLASYDKPIRDQINMAYGRVPETNDEVIQLRKKIAKDLSSLVNVPVESSPPIDERDLMLTPVADGRMMQVTRIDGSPVIKAKRGPVEITIQAPLYGLLAGVWERVM